MLKFAFVASRETATRFENQIAITFRGANRGLSLVAIQAIAE
jgi:hypothetical protein